MTLTGRRHHAQHRNRPLPPLYSEHDTPDAERHPEYWALYRAPNGREHTLNRSYGEMLSVLERWGWVEVRGGR